MRPLSNKSIKYCIEEKTRVVNNIGVQSPKQKGRKSYLKSMRELNSRKQSLKLEKVDVQLKLLQEGDDINDDIERISRIVGSVEKEFTNQKHREIY